MADETDLAAARKALGLSQVQLAGLLGVTQGTVSRNETSAAPERRYVFALEGLKARVAAGESLVTEHQASADSNGTSAEIAPEPTETAPFSPKRSPNVALCSACDLRVDDPHVRSCTDTGCPLVGREAA